jgi:hypothetical protein
MQLTQAYKDWMGFQANVLKVMIASPGDVSIERGIVTEGLYRWNDANAVSRELMLQPVKWETHSSPQMGAHPQAIINERLFIDADIVVGIFGTRIGTATPEFISGSVEEIKRQVAAGKLAMLYFSRVPVDPSSIDRKQWTALQTFKEECKLGGLYAEYESHEQLRADFAQHLTIELNRPKYLWLRRLDVAVEPHDPELSADEKRLLTAAGSDINGQILTGTLLSGFYVQTNGENFVEDSPRSAAIWKAAIRRLRVFGYLSQASEEVYEVTEDGYKRVEMERRAAPLELSLSFVGTPDKQVLSVESSKPVALQELHFMTSSEARISGMEIGSEGSLNNLVALDHSKIVELFNTPRPDMNHYDHAGPAALRLTFTLNGRRNEVVLPVMLQPKSVNSTQWIQLSGSKVFVLRPA